MVFTAVLLDGIHREINMILQYKEVSNEKNDICTVFWKQGVHACRIN